MLGIVGTDSIPVFVDSGTISEDKDLISGSMQTVLGKNSSDDDSGSHSVDKNIIISGISHRDTEGNDIEPKLE